MGKVLVRGMRDDDLEQADRIMRLAFGTFLGLPDPMKFMGDADYVRTRYRADPAAALVAEIDGKLAGSNFALDWGSVGIFGPLTVHPDYWDKGVAREMLEHTMKIFEQWGTRHVGLFTFAQSSKHVHLYQKFGFWPQYLTAVMSKPVGRVEDVGVINYSKHEPEEQKEMLKECARLTDAIFGGLDLKKEVTSTEKQRLGDTILLKDDSGLSGFAICHVGPGTEAGSGNCYVKFGAVASVHDSGRVFDELLDACEGFARSQSVTRLVAGVNTGRHNAYRKMLDRGFRTDMLGVAMHRPREPGYNLAATYLIDDWR